MKKTIIIALTILMFLTGISSLNSYASEKDGEFGEVVMVAIPNGNGDFKYYTGNDAKSVYMQILDQSTVNTLEAPEVLEEMPTKDEIVLRGPFSYKYRFIKESSGAKYGNSRRISQVLENTSSKTQQLQTSVISSTSWSINISLSGKFKEAFEASVGGGWANTSSFSQIITMNVGPNKRMWLEFKPLLRYVSGKSQKYFIPRGPVNKKPVVVESKSVYSTSPKKISITLGSKTFTGTDGVYIWKETRLK